MRNLFYTPRRTQKRPLADRPLKAQSRSGRGVVCRSVFIVAMVFVMISAVGAAGGETAMSQGAAPYVWAAQPFMAEAKAPENLSEWLNGLSFFVALGTAIWALAERVKRKDVEQRRVISPDPLNVRKATEFATVEHCREKHHAIERRVEAVERRQEALETRISQMTHELTVAGEDRAKRIHERIDNVTEVLHDLCGQFKQLTATILRGGSK